MPRDELDDPHTWEDGLPSSFWQETLIAGQQLQRPDGFGYMLGVPPHFFRKTRGTKVANINPGQK